MTTFLDDDRIDELREDARQADWLDGHTYDCTHVCSRCHQSDTVEFTASQPECPHDADTYLCENCLYDVMECAEDCPNRTAIVPCNSECPNFEE